jgi:hypothetical protein
VRSADLRQLQPFIDHVQHDHRVLRAALALVLDDPTFCSCTFNPDTKRWESTGTCEEQPPPSVGVCLTLVHIAVRRQLTSMSIPTEHLDDDQLVQALDDLHTLTLQVAEVSRDEFVAHMQAALHAGTEHGGTEAAGAR